jgi:glutathione S-transferase
VLIALEEKGIPYRSVCVSFSSGVLKSPFFRALNPRMRVPVLVEPQGDDGASLPTAPSSGAASPSPLDVNWLLHSQQPRTVLYESAAILEYLERRFPTVPCLPRDVRSFAVAQTRMHEANEILSVVGDLVVYLRRFPAQSRSAAAVQAKWAALEHELGIWEQYLDNRPYLVSMDTPYLCDFTLFTNVAYAVRCGLQLDGLYPRLAMFYVRLCARASVEKTWPPHWKTTFGTKVLTKCFSCSSAAPCACCRGDSEQLRMSE